MGRRQWGRSPRSPGRGVCTEYRAPQIYLDSAAALSVRQDLPAERPAWRGRGSSTRFT